MSCLRPVYFFSMQMVAMLLLLLLASAGGDVCGNGQMLGGETCDDGNLMSGDGCSSSCTIECGFLCSSIWGTAPGAGPISAYGFFNSTCEAEYGDGKRRKEEQCDDGNLLAGDGCSCTLASQYSAGGCMIEENWRCDPVADAAINCASRVPMGDYCQCITEATTVRYPAQPLLGKEERTETVLAGFAGASAQVKCASCRCDFYGNCDTGSHCNWETTCSGNGFCDGGGQCVCFGNFTGDNCNRCKCNHFGESCNKFCDPLITCGGHGVCDFNGECLKSPMCDGIDTHTHICGDGLRLGLEECDDNNTLSGDGCSSECTVEDGFVCLGGCSHTGDIQVNYGECRRDSCLALPCGFHMTDLSQDYSQGVLFVDTPQFVTKSIQHSTPLAKMDNILRITLTANIPIPKCIRSTLTLDERVENRPWLSYKREVTRLCERTRITISGLTGIRNSEFALGEEENVVVQSDKMIRIRSMASSLSDSTAYDKLGSCFGYSAERTALGFCDEPTGGMQECDPSIPPTESPTLEYHNSLVEKFEKCTLKGAGFYFHSQAAGDAYLGEASIYFTVLEDIPAYTPLEFMITVSNNEYRNAAPRIRVEMSGECSTTFSLYPFPVPSSGPHLTYMCLAAPAERQAMLCCNDFASKKKLRPLTHLSWVCRR